MFLWVNVLNSCHFPPLRLVRIYVGWSDSCSRLVIHLCCRGVKGKSWLGDTAPWCRCHQIKADCCSWPDRAVAYEQIQRSECAPWQNSWPSATPSQRGAILFPSNSPIRGHFRSTKCSLGSMVSSLSLYVPVTQCSPYLHLLKWHEVFSDIRSHSETVVVSYHIYKEEGIAALKKALRSLSEELH